MQKDIHNNQSTEEHTLEENQFFAYVYKKTERVISALYVVTNLITREEPLKWQLRHKGISFLGEILPLHKKPITRKIYRRVERATHELLSLIEIGVTAGLLSSMNATLLQKEFQTIVEAVEKESSHTLSHDFFTLAPRLDVVGARSVDTQHVSNTFDKGHGTKIKDTQISKSHKGKRRGQDSSLSEERITSRQARIYSVLTKHDSLSVHELSRFISDVSEKTLQRDLGVLLSLGRVQKFGKRRWTRYSTQ